MADYFKWDDKYKLDIKEIDDQHQYFVSLLNDLYKTILDSADRSVMAGVLDKLMAYAVDHFSTEEKYFKAFNYEGREEHEEEHQKLLDKLTYLHQQFINNQADLSFELIDFLENWLVDHLDAMDKKYVDCFHEHGLR